jgi:hypothetical protein
MKPKSYVVLLLLLANGVVSACQSNQQAATLPTPTPFVEPSPTAIRLPPALTPTRGQPTPANTPVVVASYTPKPPTDTPTPRPTPTETSTPVITEEATPAEAAGIAVIDWVDTDGKPTLITGEDEGLYVWTEGDRVYLRGITRGNKYIFQGQARGHGAIVNIDPLAQDIDVTIGDNVSQLAFVWTTVGGPEGLDFSFSGDKLLLNFSIAGIPEPEPNLVFVGPDKRRTGMSVELVR